MNSNVAALRDRWQCATWRQTAGRPRGITLISNSSTGYRWKLVSEPDPNVLTLLSSDYRVPVPQPSQPPLAGAGGVEMWRFAAVGAGDTHLRLSYIGPSPTSRAGGDFALDVHVN